MINIVILVYRWIRWSPLSNEIKSKTGKPIGTWISEKNIAEVKSETAQILGICIFLFDLRNLNDHYLLIFAPSI